MSLLPFSRTVTWLPICTVLIAFLGAETTSTYRRISSSSSMRPSINVSSSIAAEYSLFSERSPRLFAVARRLTAYGRFLFLITSYSSFRSSKPSLVSNIFFFICLFLQKKILLPKEGLEDLKEEYDVIKNK